MRTLRAGIMLGLTAASLALAFPERQARTIEFFIVAEGKPRTSPAN